MTCPRSPSKLVEDLRLESRTLVLRLVEAAPAPFSGWELQAVRHDASSGKELITLKIVRMIPDKWFSVILHRCYDPCVLSVSIEHLLCARPMLGMQITAREELLKPVGLKPDGTMTPLEEVLSQYSAIEETSSDTD